jgi:hypothetical protein
MPSAPNRKCAITKSTRKSNTGRGVSQFTNNQRQSLRIAILQSLVTVQRHNAINSNVMAAEDIAASKLAAPQKKNNELPLKTLHGPSDDSYGIPAGRSGWYRIQGIVAQRLSYYLVNWEGINPETGKDWPADFVRNFFLSPLNTLFVRSHNASTGLVITSHTEYSFQG